MNAARVVQPEILDDLAPDDPRARRSRLDLRRIHVAMGSAGILRRALDRSQMRTPPRRILEIGAGDGTLLLRVARRLAPAWRDVELTLLDRVDLVAPATRDGYAQLGWRVEVSQQCVLEWARSGDACRRYDLCIAALFLHHFAPQELDLILRAIAGRADRFVAVEPRRGALPLLGSRLVAALGANAVTRADAVASVRAGFAGDELQAAWPGTPDRWQLAEYPAGPFTHCFVAAASDGY